MNNDLRLRTTVIICVINYTPLYLSCRLAPKCPHFLGARKAAGRWAY